MITLQGAHRVVPLVLWLTPFILRAATSSDLIIDSSGSNAVITGCKDSAVGHLEIPATAGGKPVTAIAESAFFNCHGLTSIHLGEQLTEIGSFAFFGLRGLQTVDFGPSVRQIGQRAFNACSGLTRVRLNDALRDIGASAFERCTQLSKISIPAKIASIGRNAFRYCDSLRNIRFHGNAPTIDSNAFDALSPFATITVPIEATGYDEAALGQPLLIIAASLRYRIRGDIASAEGFEDSVTGRVKILESVQGASVTSIGDSAFDRCSGISEVIIPESITEIARRAFRDCTGLETVRIPDSITRIEDEAFSGCTALKNLTLGEAIRSIGKGAFQDCASLTEVIVPDEVNNVGDFAFADCSSLVSIKLGERVSNVGSWAFSQCTSLESIEFGPRFRWFRNGVLEGCHQLTRVVFLGNAPSYRGNMFSALNPDLTVFATAGARGYRATLGGAPVEFLDGERPEIRIHGARFDIAGNFVIRVKSGNEQINVFHSTEPGTAFKAVTQFSTRGASEVVIRAGSPELEGDLGFFRIVAE